MEIDYYELVENCASKKLDVEIANGKIDHAQILLEAMLRHGKKNINIFSGELKEELYSDFRFQTWVQVYYLISKGTLTFIIQNLDDLENHTLYSFVKELDPEFKRIKFYIVNKDSEASKEENHFAIMDDSAYRLETDDENVKAKANFNDKSKNTELTTKFNTFLTQSTQYAA